VTCPLRAQRPVSPRNPQLSARKPRSQQELRLVLLSSVRILLHASSLQPTCKSAHGHQPSRSARRLILNTETPLKTDATSAQDIANGEAIEVRGIYARLSGGIRTASDFEELLIKGRGTRHD
jgi:hypothetical protein